MKYISLLLLLTSLTGCSTYGGGGVYRYQSPQCKTCTYQQRNYSTQPYSGSYAVQQTMINRSLSR